MNGINAIFHLGSAVATVWLVVLLLRLKRQRDLMRRILGERHLAAGARRVVVETPRAFLGALAAACGIAFEAAGPGGPPARLDAEPLLELFFKRGLTLIRCQHNAVELHLAVKSPSAAGPGAAVSDERLAKALGGQVQVKVIG